MRRRASKIIWSLLTLLQLLAARSSSSSLLHTVQEMANGLLVDWNITRPAQCVPLISVTGGSTAMPRNASDLADKVGWLISTWGLQLNDEVQTDRCVQGAIASFGQDPIALVAGRCRSRCEQTIDACGVCGGISYPSVELEGGPFQSYRRGQDVRIATSVVWDNTGCAMSHRMVYRWSAQLHESVGLDKPTLTIPSNWLPSGGTVLPVLLEVGVVPNGRPLGDETSTFATKLRANVTILRSPIVARISGGSRDIPPFVDLVLNASSSVDLDEEAGPLLFFWTCREVQSNRPCSIPSVAAPAWSIAARDLIPGMTYDFRVLVLKGDRSDSASTRIRVAASNLPVTATLRPLAGSSYKVDPNRRLVVQGQVTSLEPIQAGWTVSRKFATGADDAEINTTGFRQLRSINEVSLVLPARSLPMARESVEYTFRLTASGAGGTSFAEMTILLNSPPSGGSIRVDPEHGYAFNWFILMSEESSWSDDAEDFPLMCRFGYVGAHGQQRYLTDTAQAFVSPPVVLPVGDPPLFNYSAFVQATDVWGSSSLATRRVHVAPGNATINDGVLALVRTTGIGDTYSAYQIIDALSAQDPESSVVDEMSRALRSSIAASAITVVSAARVVNTLGHVARNDLSDASIDNCIAILDEIAACARRDGAGLQPCQFSGDDVNTLTDAISNLFNAAQASLLAAHSRRLAESQLGISPESAARARAYVLLDMVQVLSRAILQPLASGESKELSTDAFKMHIHRRQELDFLSQQIPSWNQKLLSISNAWALPGAALRTLGAVITVWRSGSMLPFYWDTVAAQPACVSRLTDVEVGNTTRWSRRGIFKQYPQRVQCEGLPSLSTSVVSAQFLTETEVPAVVTIDRNDSRPYVVRIPTDSQYGCGYGLNDSGPLINCSRYDGSQWVLDGLPVERTQSDVVCAFSTSAVSSSTGFAAFCAPAPRYEEIDLTTSVPEHTVQYTGFYVCCGILPVFIAAQLLELSRLRERKRTAKVARKTAFREWIGRYGHRDTTFTQRVRIRSITSSHTLAALVRHLEGNPHTKSEGLILIATTVLISAAVSSVLFQSPVPALLCERICTCLEDRLTGPECEYTCHVECRSFDCGSPKADLECASVGSHAFCELDKDCSDFEPSARVVQGIGATVATLVPIMLLTRCSFVWLRAPVKSFILGDKLTPVCSQCRPKAATHPQAEAAANKYDVADGTPEPEELDNELAEAMIAKLHNKFTPVHMQVTQVNDVADTPARFKIVVASSLFKKLPADKQRRALVTATLADELAKHAKIDVLESWTPAQWREIERQAAEDTKRKARQKARGQMKLTALLGRTPVEFNPRGLWPSTCPYILCFALATTSIIVIVMYSRHFVDSTTSFWLLTSGTAALMKLTVVDLVLLLFEPKGPVHFFVVKRAWPWLYDQIQAWQGQRRVRVNNDGDLVSELSSSEDEVEDETAIGLAWEFYHGKRHKPKRPVIETPKRPPTPEVRAWAREMHDAVEDRTAISFRKDVVLQTVALPNALNRDYVPETLKKQVQWNKVLAENESKAIGIAHAKFRDKLDKEAKYKQAVAHQAQHEQAFADAARSRRNKLTLAAAQTEVFLAEEREREVAGLRAEEQARKYQQTLDEAARRRTRRAELVVARSSSSGDNGMT